MDTAQAGLAGGGVEIAIALSPASDAVFRARSGAPDFEGAGALWAEAAPIPEAEGDGAIMVVLDPGHGGIDPGAVRGDLTEADLMLAFARELREVLVRTGGFRVILTRNSDEFVPLDRRATSAREAGADLFLSLHADAVAEGRATGASVYTLSDTATDEAAAALAERHERGDLLAGVDLAGQDDAIAAVLMEIARLDTAPRSGALADAIVMGLELSVGDLHVTPRLQAGFSVLRAPDIPSALLELGFLSSEGDRERLASPEWQRKAAQGIANALGAWAEADGARAVLLRQ
jgi:N-acetylmuramoyl-L-alanine amidase